MADFTSLPVDHKQDDFLASVPLSDEVLKNDEVVYGVTDMSNRSFSQKIDDYLVDHAKVSLKEKSYFFHLLAVMLDAGLPILKAIRSLAKRSVHRRFRRVLRTMAYHIENGKKLSEVMEKFPDIFSESDIGVVRSGEAVGHLDQMLFRLSDQIDKDRFLKDKIARMMWYPAIVMGVLVLVVAVVVFFVIPALQEFFAASGIELPLPTRIVLGTSNFVTSYWWLFILAGVAFYALITAYTHTDAGRFKWDYYKLRLPLVGTIMRKIIVARFMILLSVLVEAGLPINKTLKIISRALVNDVYRRKILVVKARVEEGQRISHNLQDVSFLFPSTVVNMLNIGENSASVGPIAEKLSSHYMKEVDSSVKKLTTVFQPLVLLLVAVFVGILAVAIIMPLFTFVDVIAV